MDIVVVISDKLKKIYQHKISNLVLVYNGVDVVLDESRRDAGVVSQIIELHNAGFKVVGTYAYLTRIKGLEQLIRLLPARSDLAVIIIGQGEAKQELMTLSNELAVVAQVVFFDYLPTPYNYVSLFDVYAMCSRSEGFGLALVEAALTKASIVCSDIEVFREIFNDTQVSYFVLDDVKSLSNAIDVALSDKGVLKGIEAYTRSLEKFSGEAMADNYLHIYKSVICNGKI